MAVEVPASQKPVAPEAKVKPRQDQVHPCIAYPDLYPVKGPRVVAGRIHYHAVKILDRSLDRHLQRMGAEAYEIAGDALPPIWSCTRYRVLRRQWEPSPWSMTNRRIW